MMKVAHSREHLNHIISGNMQTCVSLYFSLIKKKFKDYSYTRIAVPTFYSYSASCLFGGSERIASQYAVFPTL